MNDATQARLTSIALTGRVLGTLLSLSPDAAENRPLFAALAAPGWID